MRSLSPDSFAFPRFAGRLLAAVLVGIPLLPAPCARAADEPALLDIERRVTHGYATNDGVRIHYARLGEGPLVVMIHGFPDCWLTWRAQMEALAQDHETVAMDQRGYNLSGRPKGVENYDLNLLVADVAAVIRARGRERAILVGHDWGGIVAWTFAMTRPEMTEKLVILNLPHPRRLRHELATNPEQQKNSAYARRFQQEGAHTNLTAEGLTFWIKEPAVRARYVEAFHRSDFEAMLNYYKRNYPREPYTEDTSPLVKVQCPVLMIHGLTDTALGQAALNGNWQYVEQHFTLVTVPGAGHFVQQDAADFVTRTIVGWLLAAKTSAAAPEKQKPTTDHGPLYRLVNRTGKFSDAECFWSLNNGQEWHSFAQEPTVPCPRGNGRLYFRLGATPRNFDDREAGWDFIEYASENSEIWHGNTTQVDAFCIPITIEMGDKKVGINEPRRSLFEQFRKDAPEPFKSCVKGTGWIVSPCRATFGAAGPDAHYFDAYIDEVWAMYAQEKKTPSGKWIGKVTNGTLTFTPVDGKGKPLTCASKPSTQDAFMGTGVLATNPQFCAAINRHVLADPADWRNAEAFYNAEPCNWYAKFLHEHSIANKAYGFCYDDVAEQAAFFSGKGREVVITLRWDSEPKGN